jgi:hypothetical protein
MDLVALENLDGAMASAARRLGDGVARTSIVERLLDAILGEFDPTRPGPRYEWVDLQSRDCSGEIVSRRYDVIGLVPGLEHMRWLCDVAAVLVAAFANDAAHARFDELWTRQTGVAPRWGMPSMDAEPYRRFIGRTVRVTGGDDHGRMGFIVDAQVLWGLPWFIVDLDHVGGDRIECAHGRILVLP